MLLLVLASAAVLLAAALVSTRARYESRAEFLLACSVLWNFLALVPIHVLGLLNRLTPGLLFLLVLFECALIGLVFSLKVDRRSLWADLRSSLGAALMLPFTALKETYRAKSFAFFGLLACGWLILYTLWLSYLLPSDSWDGLWYHELMIGYAIQNHGYAPINLPTDVPFPASMINQANGFPRNADMTNLWFALFAGRDLVEVVNSFAEIPLMLATFCLARRITNERSSAIGWAAAVATLPVLTMQLRSTYIDLHVASLYMAAIHFSTRPRMRLHDACMAMVALSILIGAKSVTLASVPVLWLVVVMLAGRQNWGRKRALLAWLGAGSLLIVAMASVCYLRNWVLFDNPLWPMSYELKGLGIQFKGLAPIDAIVKNQGEFTVERTLTAITAYRVPGQDYADTGSWGYGDGFAFLVVPLGFVALVMLFIDVIRRLIAYSFKLPPRPEAETTLQTALLAAVLLGIGIGAPTLWYPRYNAHLAGGLMLMVAWLGRRPRFSDAVSAVVLVTNLIFVYRAKPAWGVSFQEAISYAARPAFERDYHSPSPWSITPPVAIARDLELGPGTRVAFGADVPFVFVAQLWNERYTNELHYVPPTSTREFLAGAERIGAKWVVIGESHSISYDLKSRPREWELIGKVSRGYPSIAFRKLAR